MIESYPYLVHTNRELDLMVQGTKPLAVFCVDNVEGKEQFTKEMVQAHQDFDSHVKSNFLNLDHMRLTEPRGRDSAILVFDYYAYTLKGEEWRAKAYFELMRMLKNGKWCQNLERLEGTLLGYSDEQNDFHIRRKYDGSCKESRRTDPAIDGRKISPTNAQK